MDDLTPLFEYAMTTRKGSFARRFLKAEIARMKGKITTPGEYLKMLDPEAHARVTNGDDVEDVQDE